MAESGSVVARILHSSVQHCTNLCRYFPVYSSRLFVGSEPEPILHQLSVVDQDLRCHQHPHRRGYTGSSHAVSVEVESFGVQEEAPHDYVLNRWNVSRDHDA